MDILKMLWPEQEDWNTPPTKGIDEAGRLHRLFLLEHYGLVLRLLSDTKQEYLVPALLKDELCAQKQIEDAPFACEFIFDFSDHNFLEDLSNSATSVLESGSVGKGFCPFLESDRVGKGFLPRALLLRLLGMCVQMTQASGTSMNASPPTRRSGVFMLHTQEFILHLKEGVHDTIMLSCSETCNPRAIFHHVEAQLAKVVRQCFPSLKFGAFLSVEGTEARLNLQWLQIQWDRKSTIQMPGMNLKCNDAKEKFGKWLDLAPSSLLDATISYRQTPESATGDDSKFAEMLYEWINLGAGQPAVSYDRKIDFRGQKEACVRMEKIASSRVFVPLISWDTLNRILHPTGSLDYVLLEWIFALEMKEHDQVDFIFPIFIGSTEGISCGQ